MKQIKPFYWINIPISFLISFILSSHIIKSDFGYKSRTGLIILIVLFTISYILFYKIEKFMGINKSHLWDYQIINLIVASLSFVLTGIILNLFRIIYSFDYNSPNFMTEFPIIDSKIRVYTLFAYAFLTLVFYIYFHIFFMKDKKLKIIKSIMYSFGGIIISIILFIISKTLITVLTYVISGIIYGVAPW